MELGHAPVRLLKLEGLNHATMPRRMPLYSLTGLIFPPRMELGQLPVRRWTLEGLNHATMPRRGM